MDRLKIWKKVQIDELEELERRAKAFDWLAEQVKESCYANYPAWLNVVTRYDSADVLEIRKADLLVSVEAEMERSR